MNKTLVINSGSSSLKFQLFENQTNEVLIAGLVERIGMDMSYLKLEFNDKKVKLDKDMPNHGVAIKFMLDSLIEYNIVKDIKEITSVGHRVVQGGEYFNKSVSVGQEELNKIYELAELAPLHNVPNGKGIEECMKILPDALNVAVFDTEFHTTLEPKSFLYPVPKLWYDEYKVRKYGMHGTSYKYIVEKMAEIKNKSVDDMNMIICHLGNGASLCATEKGKSIQTSMGLTPLDGIMMGTRSGSIDPSIFEYVNSKTGMDIKEITKVLNKESGLAGMSGVSSDFRDLIAEMEKGNEDVKLTVDIYVNRIVETIGSYFFRLKKVDAIVFTAGIGENVAMIRDRVIAELNFLGVKLEATKNNNNELVISSDDSSIEVLVLPTNEEYQIYKEVQRISLERN